MPIVRLDDPDDDRVADYARLTDVVLRSRHEPNKGLYIAESSNVIRRAIAAGHRPRSFLMAPRWLERLDDVLESVGAGEHGDIPVYIADEGNLEKLTGFHLHRGALAAMHRPALAPVAEVIAAARRIAILEDIVDHTNVGAAFRSAAALGVDAVLVTPRCADPFYRRSVRVSMGTVFQVPWTRIDPWPEGVDELRAAGFTVAALALTEGAITLDDVASDPPQRLAWVLGTEGDGLSREAVEAVDIVVKIPMAGGVDSLNVAAAAAVAFWATRV